MMQNEKFDPEFSEKILDFDRDFIPEFNEKKVWRNTYKNRSPLWIWFYAAAAMAIIVGVGALLYPEHEKVESAGSNSSKKPGIETMITKDSSPTVRKTDTRAKRFGNSGPVKQIPVAETVLITMSTPAITFADTSTQIHVQQILTNENELATSFEKSVIEPETKVTFKRGIQLTDAEPQSSIVLKKFKLRILENQLYDTSAYASGAEVPVERKLRIRF